MAALIFLFTIPFVCIAFLTASKGVAALDPFTRYILLELDFINTHNVTFFLIFIIISIFSVTFISFDKKYSFINKVFFSWLQTLLSLVIAFFLSFIIICIIAVAQMNTFALLVRSNPQLLGVETDIRKIAVRLKQTRNQPNIIASEDDTQKILLGLVRATTGTDNYYGKNLLPSIPSFFVLPIKTSEASIQLLDNTLVISAIKPEDIQVISPVLGYHLVKQYFQNRHIKFYPDISVMTQEEYALHRDADIKKSIAEIDIQTTRVNDLISSVSATIQQDEQTINAEKQNNSVRAKEKNDRYIKCLNTGSYINGTFNRVYTKEYCVQLVGKNQPVASDSATTENLLKKLETDQLLLKQYQYYKVFFQTQRIVVQNSKANIPHELGAFIPPKELKLLAQSTTTDTLTDFLETLTHEYLHYASSQPTKKHFSDIFFEEGLTEYFARQIMRENLHIETNLGYPVFVKIIEQITKIIPESELADIYFTKDQEALEKALNRVYGDNFYASNKIIFNTLPYTSDPDQVLVLANDLMKKIDGSPLKRNDLLSDPTQEQ